jgi:hypothetical protein
MCFISRHFVDPCMCCCALVVQAAVDEARQQLAAGQAVPGILGSLVSAVDENGNR